MARLYEGFGALLDSLEFFPFAPLRRGPEPVLTIEVIEEVREQAGESHATAVYEDFMRRWKAWSAAKPVRAGMVVRFHDGGCMLIGHYNEFMAMLDDGHSAGWEDEIESVAYLY